MVLVHKLKQMEELDIEHLMNNEEDMIPSQSGQQERYDAFEKVPQTAERTGPTISPPRRPLTRSQTGRVAKRRPRDESPVETRKLSPTPRKKSKLTTKTTTEEPEATQRGDTSSTPEAPKRDASEMSEALTTPLLTTTQLTFLDVSSSSSDTAVDRRGPRSRATLPVAVPNLTKKSRGRRVPTKLGPEVGTDQDGTRLYVCNVDGCGKCFHRGEHLKRHIRSIHTHEKPFKCSHPACDKFFNRHDNLLQHLKVHKELATPQASCPPDEVLSPVQQEQRPSVSYSPVDESSRPIEKSNFLQHASSFVSYSTTTPYGSSLEPSGFTNMAISSLRTEMPHSPPVSRMRDTSQFPNSAHFDNRQEGSYTARHALPSLSRLITHDRHT